MNFTQDERKYIIHAIDALTKQEGIINAGLGIAVINKLKDVTIPDATKKLVEEIPHEAAARDAPMTPSNGLDVQEVADDAPDPEPAV